MTRPTQVLFSMVPFLALVGLAVAVLYAPLADAFYANPVFNGIILVVFLGGIVINFRQVGTLSSEVAWINRFRGKKASRFRRAVPEHPRLLAPLARMLGQHETELLSLSPLSLRSLLDSVRLRLDESRDLSRYVIGLLIFLGLLGTFWGLLVTVGAVGDIINELADNAAEAAVFGTLLEGLRAPLSGMGTAFSSSLFGLAGSLVLGFLDLQAGHAQNRFFNELEDWLSGVTRLSGGTIGERELSEPAYIHAMLEQTAETLDRLQRHVTRDEEQRRVISDQIMMLARELAVFADLARDSQKLLVTLGKGQGEMAPLVARLAEARGADEDVMQQHMRNLDVNIKRLADELASGNQHLAEEIRDELRLIGRALSAETHGRSRNRKQAKAG
ncbi:MAG: flagellar motor protein MotA [Gammaproteobacteria bacterium]|nr:MAG: flagellar motor protein MotA [Gammaproteobacteria bacterium]